MAKTTDAAAAPEPLAEDPPELTKDQAARLDAATEDVASKVRLDLTTYDKTLVCKLGQGFERRSNADRILAIVAHTTNGHKGSSFEAEAQYLQTSKTVGAHWLIGQATSSGLLPIARIVPDYLAAWQAGPSFARGYGNWNDFSIGIEIQCAGDEGENVSELQKAAFRWLSMRLRAWYPGIYMLERHADVAVDKQGNLGRKHDPNGWIDPDMPELDPAQAWKRFVDGYWRDPYS